MEHDYTKSPEQLAEDARQTGRDAVDAAQEVTSDAAAIGRDAFTSLEAAGHDAKALGRDALAKAAGIAHQARKVSDDAAETGRAYAKDAVNATGRKIIDWRTQFSRTGEYCSKLIADEPVKAVWIASIASSLLTALVITAARSGTRYRGYDD